MANNPFDLATPLADTSSNPFDQAMPVQTSGPQKAVNVQSNDAGAARFGTLSGTSQTPQAQPQSSKIGQAATSFAMGAGAPLYSLTGQLASGFGMFPNRFAQGQTDIANQANQYRQDLGNRGGVSGFANNLVGQAGEMSTFMPLAYAAGVPALEAGVTPMLGSLGTSALVRGGVGGLMATPLMTAMHPTDPNKSFGQSVAENVPSTMGQMALMSGGMSALGETPRAYQAGKDMLFKRSAEQIPNGVVASLPTVDQIMNHANSNSVITAANTGRSMDAPVTISDLQDIAQGNSPVANQAKSYLAKITAASAVEHGKVKPVFNPQTGQATGSTTTPINLSQADLTGDAVGRLAELKNQGQAGSIGNDIRAEQNQQLQEAITNLRASQATGVGSIPKSSDLSSVANHTIKTDLSNQFDAARSNSNALYGKIDSALEAAGVENKVPTPQTESVLSKAIEDNNNSLGRDPELGRILDDYNNQFSKPDADRSYQATHQAVSKMEGQIGPLLDKGNRSAARTLQELKGTLDTEADGWAKNQLGASSNLIDEASADYKKNVVPFIDSDTGIPQILSAQYPDEGVRKLLATNRPDMFDTITSQMSPEGRKALQVKLTEAAHEAASVGGELNPQTWAKFMDRHNSSIESLYGRSEGPVSLNKIQGLTNLIQRAEESGHVVPQSLMGDLASGMGAGGTAGALGALGALGGVGAAPAALGGVSLGMGARLGITRNISNNLFRPSLVEELLKPLPTPGIINTEPPVQPLPGAGQPPLGSRPTPYQGPMQSAALGTLGQNPETAWTQGYGPSEPTNGPARPMGLNYDTSVTAGRQTARSVGAAGMPAAEEAGADFQSPVANPQFTMQGRAGEGFADPYANLRSAQEAHAAAQGETAFSENNLGNAIVEKRRLTNETAQAKEEARQAFEAAGGTKPMGWSQVDRDYQHQAFDQDGNLVGSYGAGVNRQAGMRGNVVREPTPEEMDEVAERIGNWMDYLKKKGISGKEEVLLPNNVPPRFIAGSRDPFATMPSDFHPGSAAELRAEYDGMAQTQQNIRDFADRTRRGELPVSGDQTMDQISDWSAKTSRVKDLQQQLRDMANSPINIKSLQGELADAQQQEFNAFQNVRRLAVNERQPGPSNNPNTQISTNNPFPQIPTTSLSGQFSEPGQISNPRNQIQTATRGIVPQQSLSAMSEPYATPQSGQGPSNPEPGSVGAMRNRDYPDGPPRIGEVQDLTKTIKDTADAIKRKEIDRRSALSANRVDLARAHGTIISNLQNIQAKAQARLNDINTNLGAGGPGIMPEGMAPGPGNREDLVPQGPPIPEPKAPETAPPVNPNVSEYAAVRQRPGYAPAAGPGELPENPPEAIKDMLNNPPTEAEKNAMGTAELPFTIGPAKSWLQKSADQIKLWAADRFGGNKGQEYVDINAPKPPTPEALKAADAIVKANPGVIPEDMKIGISTSGGGGVKETKFAPGESANLVAQAVKSKRILTAQALDQAGKDIAAGNAPEGTEHGIAAVQRVTEGTPLLPSERADTISHATQHAQGLQDIADMIKQNKFVNLPNGLQLTIDDLPEIRKNIIRLNQIANNPDLDLAAAQIATRNLNTMHGLHDLLEVKHQDWENMLDRLPSTNVAPPIPRRLK